MKTIKMYCVVYMLCLFVFVPSAAAQTYVTIEVQPTAINPGKNGLITVAIITDTEFDATTIDPLTVLFGPEGATEQHGTGHIEDANNDGFDDLVLHFKAKKTGIECGDSLVVLQGETFWGEIIEGNADIITVGKKCRKIYRARRNKQ